MQKKRRIILIALVVVGAALGGLYHMAGSSSEGQAKEIINVSYDPTREFYEAYNADFESYYKAKTGQDVVVHQSHGGSSNQARAVVEGFDVDVVTLALAQDVNLLQKVHLLNPNWENELPNYSAPYTSTIVFLVRKGNPLGISDWGDLIKPGVRLIAPDPKSSGGAAWIFLAAYAYGSGPEWNEAAGERYVKEFYNHVTVMDAGARGATTTFVENKQGDVLIAWENEAIQSMNNHPGVYEIVIPSVSIVAEPSVALVAELAKKRGTYDIAKEYLTYLYDVKSQRLIAKYVFRPTNPEVMKEVANQYPTPSRMVTIRDFGGWTKAYERFFEDGAVFDTLREQ